MQPTSRPQPARLARLAATGLAAALWGCATPDLSEPSSIAPDVARGTGLTPSWAGAGAPPTAESIRASAAKAVPSPLDEREAIRLALEGSPDLARMIAQAEAMRHEALDMSAPMNPMLVLNSGVPLDSMAVVPVLAMMMFQVDELWTQPVRSAAARDTYEAMLLDVGASAITMAAQARSMWHEVQLREEELAHAVHDREITARLLDIARAGVDAGESDRSAVQAAQSEFADAHHRAALAQERRDAARLQLMAMMGRADAPADWTLGEPDSTAAAAIHLPLADEESLLDALADSRLDVRAAQARVRAAESRAELARRGRLRQFSVGAGYERSMEDMSAVMVGANVELPIFNDGSARIAKAEADARAAALDLERIRQAAVSQLRIALARAQSADARRDITMSAVVAPGVDAHARAREALDAGEGSVMDALDVEHDLNHARLELADMERERRMMRIDLARASGFLPVEVSP